MAGAAVELSFSECLGDDLEQGGRCGECDGAIFPGQHTLELNPRFLNILMATRDKSSKYSIRSHSVE